MLRILLGLTLLLTIGAFYFAFIRKSVVSRLGFVGAFVILLVLSGVLAYAAWQDSRPPGVLSQYIDPYPGVDPIWMHPARRDAGQSWIQRTVGTPEDVTRFYSNAAHRRDWMLSKQGAMDLYLKRGTTCLHIAAAPLPTVEGRMTVLYTLREQCD